eukprot:TRINITY_DN3805_c0_g2_i2.p1 TRINITY_DN3805_c0_g2~~TRINITY_DN3805_c0_g2_i2.p1  ORF type:complete len:657 (-),score=140.70 TRINITY_DN3805_c0_g2_i2:112-2082(-)
MMKQTSTIVLLLLAYFSVGCLATQYQWVGSVSSAFSEPHNWNPVGVPGVTDSITTLTYCPTFCKINLNQASHSVANLTISSPDLHIENGTLTVTNTAFISGLNLNLVNFQTNNAQITYLFQGRVNKTNWFMTGTTNCGPYTSIKFLSANVYNQGTFTVANSFTFTATDNATTFFNSGTFAYNVNGYNYLGVSVTNTGTFQVLQGTLYIGNFRTSITYYSTWDGTLNVAAGAVLQFAPQFYANFRPTLSSNILGQVIFSGNDYNTGYSNADIYSTINFASAWFDDQVSVNVYGNVNVQSLTWGGGKLTNPSGSFTAGSVQTFSTPYYYPILLGDMTLSNTVTANYVFYLGQNAVLHMDGNWVFEQFTLRNVDDYQWAVDNVGTQTQTNALDIFYNYNNNGTLVIPQAICGSSSIFTFSKNVVQKGTMKVAHCAGKLADLIFAGATSIVDGASFIGKGTVGNAGILTASGSFSSAPFKRNTGEFLNNNFAIVSNGAFEKGAVLVNGLNGILQIDGDDFSASLDNLGTIQFSSITHMHIHGDAVFGTTGTIHLKVNGAGNSQQFNVTASDVLDFSNAMSAQFAGTVKVDFTIKQSNIDLSGINGAVIALAKWPINGKFDGHFNRVEATGLSTNIAVTTYYEPNPFTNMNTLFMQLTFSN